MKRITVSCFLLLYFSMYLCVFGEIFNESKELSLKFYDTLTINGSAKLKLVKAKSLEINGPLQFHNLDVAGKAKIDGNVNGDKGKFGQMDVTGSVDVDHVICEDLSVIGPVKASYLIVKNHADIDGTLEARHCELESLSIKADKIALEEVSLGSILIRKDQNNQVLILEGSTVVKGDIIFESGDGVVQIQNPEVQINGTVKGGTIKKITVK